MPPRFASWTILIDNKPTAFRARDQQELLPTVAQLKRKNEHVELKWFAQGRLWDSPEAQHAAGRRPQPPGEKRGDDWRPGGQHKDPRARFDKEAQRRKKREQRAEWNASRSADVVRRDRDKLGPPSPDSEWRDKAARPPQGDRSSQDRPWQTKPTGPRAERKPWRGDKGAPPHGDRKPWDKAAGSPPHGDRPRGDRPPGDRKPWQNAGGDRPVVIANRGRNRPAVRRAAIDRGAGSRATAHLAASASRGSTGRCAAERRSPQSETVAERERRPPTRRSQAMAETGRRSAAWRSTVEREAARRRTSRRAQAVAARGQCAAERRSARSETVAERERRPPPWRSQAMAETGRWSTARRSTVERQAARGRAARRAQAVATRGRCAAGRRPARSETVAERQRRPPTRRSQAMAETSRRPAAR